VAALYLVTALTWPLQASKPLISCCDHMRWGRVIQTCCSQVPSYRQLLRARCRKAVCLPQQWCCLLTCRLQAGNSIHSNPGEGIVACILIACHTFDAYLATQTYTVSGVLQPSINSLQTKCNVTTVVGDQQSHFTPFSSLLPTDQ